MDFRRSCFLLLLCSISVASEKIGASDLRRARTRVPRSEYRGSNAAAAAAALNKQLLHTPALRTADCASFKTSALRELVEHLHGKAESDLLDFYQNHNDPRAQIATSLASLHQEWAEVDSHTAADAPTLSKVVRDGLCHEAVLRFVHHLSESTRKYLAADSSFLLPLLPLHLHSAPGAEVSTKAAQAVFQDYEKKIGCQQCHTGNSEASIGGDIPKPLPVDKKQPGLERMRSCDFQNSPACGPCDGLGGPRTGDGYPIDHHDFTPVKCTVIATPAEVNVSQRVPADYPLKGVAHMVGDTRWPLVLIPDGHGQYVPEDINVSFGWDDQFARMQYSFNEPSQVKGMTQTYLQTAEQLKTGSSTGATVTVTGAGKCECQESAAGVLHVHAFMPHEKLDIMDLPGDKGGLEYLGRVHLPALDDGVGNRPVIADHYLKFAFHFLVDADKSSPTYGLPVRTYIPWGVRQVFTSWTLEDPTVEKPDIWKMPKDCKMLDDVCKVFMEDEETVTLV